MAEAKQSKTVPGLRVTAKQAGFRRAGVAWGVELTEVATSKFNKAQLAQLRAEPMLVVTDIDLPVAE